MKKFNDIKSKISSGYDANAYNSKKDIRVYVNGDVHYYVLENGSKMREIMSVGARLSTFVFRRHYQPGRAHRCRNIRSPAAQIRLCSSAEGLWSLLCAFPSTNLSKYGNFSCKSMYMDLYMCYFQE